MNNVFIVVLSDYRLSGLIRVSINTGMDQVAVDKTLFLSQGKVRVDIYVLYKKKPATGC